MKVLVGVCGIGKGHCVRQLEICKELINRGHDVRILSFGGGIEFFKDTGIRTFEIYVPYITYKGEKIDLRDVIKRNSRTFITGIIKNCSVDRELKADGFLPDVCISDYEPVTAQIAYKLKCPLITIDQQSKFLFMNNDSIEGFSCTEEKKRLSLFLPRVDQRYIVSFYQMNNVSLPSNVEVVYPILRANIRTASVSNEKKKSVVVYFSRYIDIPVQQTMEEIISQFQNFPEYEFLVYSSELFKPGNNRNKNVTILPNSDQEFAKHLSEALAVISTAGHTIISESIYFNTPIFVIPLPTYDQHYCGEFILHNRIGYSADKITTENLARFLSNLDIYRRNIKKCDSLVPCSDSLSYLVDQIEKYGEGDKAHES